MGLVNLDPRAFPRPSHREKPWEQGWSQGEVKSYFSETQSSQNTLDETNRARYHASKADQKGAMRYLPYPNSAT